MRRLEEEQHEALFFFYSLKERRKQRNKEEQKKTKKPFYTSFSSFYIKGGATQSLRVRNVSGYKKGKETALFFHVCEIEHAGSLQ